MAKYIIDLPDAYTSKSALFGDILSIPICLESGKPYGIPTGIKLEPYTEPDEDEIRQMAHEEAWEFARRIICPSDCCEDSISAHTKEIFNKEGWEIRGIFKDLSYKEAKTKYEEWEKEKRRIHVGDEVRHTLTSDIGVIMQIMDLTIMWEDGSVREDRGEHIEKTGRHFDDVESLLKKMRKGETDGKVYY